MSGPAFISLGEAGSVLQSSQPGELQYSHDIVVANPQPSSDAGYVTSTPLTFKFKPSQGRWWCPAESHLQVRMSVYGENVDPDLPLDLTELQTLAPLAPACLFENFSLEIEGKQVETIQSNVAQHAALRFRLQNKSDQRAYGKTSLWGEPDTVLSTAEIPASQTSHDRQVVFNKSRIVSFNVKIPLGVFHQPLCLPQAQYILRCSLANNFARALQSKDAQAAAIVNSRTPSASACTIRINSVDFIASYSDYGSAALISDRIVIPTENYWMTNYALSTTNPTDNVNINGLPRSATKYYFWLQRLNANSGAINNMCSPTEFHIYGGGGRNGLPPPTGSVTNNRNSTFGLVGFQAQIGSRTGPNPEARPIYSLAENNMIKFYRQFELSANLLECEDFDQWAARGPIYSFPEINIHSVDDMATDMNIRLERESVGGGNKLDDYTSNCKPFEVPTNLYVAAKHERAIILDVQQGRVTKVAEAER